MSTDFLFRQNDVRALIRDYRESVRREVEGWERNKILNVSESDLIDYLVDKYTLDPPRLMREEMAIESEGEVGIDVSHDLNRYIRDRSRPLLVPGSFVTVSIPFQGDRDLFQFRAATYDFNPPRGSIDKSNVLISFQGTGLEPEQLRQQIDSEVNQIERYLGWIKDECDEWNDLIEGEVKQHVQNRKRRLLEQANLVSALGLPLRRREDTNDVFSVPTVRKKRPVVVPPTPSEAFQPEPVIADVEFDYILEVIARLALNVERSPAAFVNMKEEHIRDLILVNLNGHYEGNATGETFNSRGKTCPAPL